MKSDTSEAWDSLFVLQAPRRELLCFAHLPLLHYNAEQRFQCQPADSELASASDNSVASGKSSSLTRPLPSNL